MKPYLDYLIYIQLKDLSYFKNFKVVFGTIQWANEEDISPDTLYLEGKEIEVAV